MDNIGIAGSIVSTGNARGRRRKDFTPVYVNSVSEYPFIKNEEGKILKKTPINFVHNFVKEYGYYPQKNENITPSREEKGEMALKAFLNSLSGNPHMREIVNKVKDKKVISKVIFKAHSQQLPEKYAVRFEGGLMIYTTQIMWNYFDAEIEYKNQ